MYNYKCENCGNEWETESVPSMCPECNNKNIHILNTIRTLSELENISWLHVDPVSGTGNDTINITVDNNTDGEDREAIIVASTLNLSKNITIKQFSMAEYKYRINITKYDNPTTITFSKKENSLWSEIRGDVFYNEIKNNIEPDTNFPSIFVHDQVNDAKYVIYGIKDEESASGYCYFYFTNKDGKTYRLLIGKDDGYLELDSIEELNEFSSSKVLLFNLTRLQSSKCNLSDSSGKVYNNHELNNLFVKYNKNKGQYTLSIKEIYQSHLAGAGYSIVPVQIWADSNDDGNMYLDWLVFLENNTIVLNRITIPLTDDTTTEFTISQKALA